MAQESQHSKLLLTQIHKLKHESNAMNKDILKMKIFTKIVMTHILKKSTV